MNKKNDETVAHHAADVVDHVVDHVADGIRSAAHTVSHAAGHAAEAVASAAQDKFEQAGQFARDSVSSGRDRVRSWEKDLEHYVRDNPKSSLLVAAALGALVTVWFKRK